MNREMKVTIAGESFVATVKCDELITVGEYATADIEMIFNPADTDRLANAVKRREEEQSGVTFEVVQS